MKLEILFEDEHFVAVNKPAGIFVHRTGLAEPGAQFALQILRNQLGRRVNPVHRLDRPTGGVLLFAFEKECTHLLCEAFSNRRVKKEYLAVVRGWVDEKGQIDSPLKSLDSQVVQEAITDYERLEKVELPIAVRPYETSRYSLVRLFPQTGRQHQLRRHLKHIFHPIVGDTRYGDGHHNESLREKYNLRRLMLFSQTLCLNHPFTGEKLTIEASLPPYMIELFKAWSWPEPKRHTVGQKDLIKPAV